MKEETFIGHRQIANDALYYIYRYIDSDINLEHLAQTLGISRCHLHRVFREQIGINLYAMIKSVRLQKASSLLLTNRYATITQIASMCGYASQTSFMRAFKARFGMTPKAWRQGGFKAYSDRIIRSSAAASASDRTFEGLEAEIVRTEPIDARYIRHRGYSPAVRSVWQKIRAWCYTHGIEEGRQIGIYHDNPAVTPLSECHYVAAVETAMPAEGGSLPSFRIPGGLYARFYVEGKYGDVLRLIRWAYHVWLPDSGYETTTAPSFTLFRKNHFLEKDGRFEAHYFLPVRLV